MFPFSRRRDTRPRVRWYNDLIFYILFVSSAIAMIVCGTFFVSIISIYRKFRRVGKDDSSK